MTQTRTTDRKWLIRSSAARESWLLYLAGVEPLNLEISSQPEDRAGDLNLWWQDCGKVLIRDELFRDDPRLETLASDELVARMTSSEFNSQDVEHIRDSLLLHRLASKLTEGIDDRLAQAVTLFDYVERSMLFWPTGESPSSSLFTAVLVGRGSIEHQAWFFAELLRQVQLDAVILQPSGAEDARLASRGDHSQ